MPVREYEEHCYRDTAISITNAHMLQPQSTNSLPRKTYNARLFIDQLLSSNQSTPHTSQLVGNSKTLLNANASCHGRWLELHFNEHGHIKSAKENAHSIPIISFWPTLCHRREINLHLRIPPTMQCLCRRGITGSLAVGRLATMP